MRKVISCTILLLVMCVTAFGQSNGEIGPYEYDRIQSIHLSRDQTFQIEAAKSHQFELLSRHPLRAGVYNKINAPAKWSVKPAHGAAINKRTGLFSVKKDVKHGTVFTITALVDLTRPWSKEPQTRSVEQKVIIYDLQTNPLIGFWKEESAAACDKSSNGPGGDPIKELEFRADGTFSVTWDPFEVYKDYWGRYNYDLRSGTINLTADNGNNVPGDLDLDGSFRIAKDVLKFENLSFGTKDGYRSLCGMTFVRY